MIRYHFDRLDRVIDNGIEMRPLRADPHGFIFQRLDMLDVEIHISYPDLALKIRSQTWRWDRFHFSPVRTQLRAEGRDRFVSLASDRDRFLAYAKSRFYARYYELYHAGKLKKTDASYQECRPIIQAMVDEDMETFWAEAAKRRNSGLDLRTRYLVPRTRQAREIIKQIDESGGNTGAVLPKWHNCGNRQPRLEPEAQLLLNREVCEAGTGRRPGDENVIQHVNRRFREENAARQAKGWLPLRIPGRKATTNALNAMDPYPTYARRWGVEEANRKFRISGAGLMEDIPLRRIEIDSWMVDAQTLFTTTALIDLLAPEVIQKIPRGRRWVIMAIDVATRCVVGIKVCKEANAKEASAVIEQVTRDKTEVARAFNALGTWHQCGTPFEVIHDNGPEFIGPEFETCLTDLRVGRAGAPAGLPFLRGAGERIFRTFGTEVMPLITARTFESILAKGANVPEDLAALTDDELTMILVLFIVDVYHKRPHRSLYGETPENCWDRLVAQKSVSPPPPPHTRRAIFGLKAQCRVGERGVQFAGLDYACPELQNMRLHSHQRDVDLRVDPTDIGHVSVRIGTEWYPAKCRQPGLDGIPYAAWTRERRKLASQHGEDARLQQPVVDRTLRLIRETDIVATLRAGLTPHSLTDEDIARGERDLRIGVDLGDAPAPAPVTFEGGLIGEVIEPYQTSEKTPAVEEEDLPLSLDPEVTPEPEQHTATAPETKRAWKVSND
ncbi:Mu transposase C-terminal domain-containing protein [Phaeobacter sp. HF9A]|uniref:Mu transposase C-terminal domain-containing protein n=1 Tax=Phaeobacter sp. HF9A TaxID=2721561 RepID=UPI0014310C08|nr:Mu transposase C-terminal domain-containing protein [Phaeobacter sp. HF9A]NIZ11929.1 transposase [Phaeobacter sp. HF9A]